MKKLIAKITGEGNEIQVWSTEDRVYLNQTSTWREEHTWLGLGQLSVLIRILKERQHYLVERNRMYGLHTVAAISNLGMDREESSSHLANEEQNLDEWHGSAYGSVNNGSSEMGIRKLTPNDY